MNVGEVLGLPDVYPRFIELKMSYLEKLNILKSTLSNCAIVTKHSTEAEDQADTLAHALIDMEESMNAITTALLPKLYKERVDKEMVEDIVMEIGEELRHILYHIRDTKVFDYLGGGESR